jgi:hypothetical protein
MAVPSDKDGDLSSSASAQCTAVMHHIRGPDDLYFVSSGMSLCVSPLLLESIDAIFAVPGFDIHISVKTSDSQNLAGSEDVTAVPRRQRLRGLLPLERESCAGTAYVDGDFDGISSESADDSNADPSSGVSSRNSTSKIWNILNH